MASQANAKNISDGASDGIIRLITLTQLATCLNEYYWQEIEGATLGQLINEIGQGLNCTFGGIASVFTAIDEVKASGGSLVGISVDLKSGSAAAIGQAAPLFSDNPVEDSAEFASKFLFQIAAVKFLKTGLPQGPISLTIYPSATPAYPLTWRVR